MTTEAITIEKLSASVFRMLTTEQASQLSTRMDKFTLTAHALDLLSKEQLMELCAMVAAESIRAGNLKLLVDDAKIDSGQLDYKLEGETAYLVLLSEELARRGELEFEKIPMFHQISTCIMGAQSVLSDIGGDEAEQILKIGQGLEKLELGSRKRAEETRTFLNRMFGLIAKKKPVHPPAQPSTG